jgi:general secretion pathway protein G
MPDAGSLNHGGSGQQGLQALLRTVLPGAVSECGAPRTPDQRMRQRGFTLIEMLIVITIVMVLTAIAIPVYRLHLVHANEAVLKEDLHTIRDSIEQYTQDKNKAPASLDELVSSGYLHLIPKDPFTNSNQTWEPVFEDSNDTIGQIGQTEIGIMNVHSGSKEVGSDGTAYNTW